jgi:glycogen(starch) synthase
MRVLAIGSMYPPHHYGGYELVWQGAMRCAREAGHEVRVLASDYRVPGIDAEEDPDIHRVFRWHWSWERNEWVKRGALGRLRLELQNGSELDRQLADFAPDVVTWWPMGGMSMGLVERVWRRGIPSLLVVHDDWLVYGPKQDAWIRLWNGRRRRLGRALDGVVGLPTRLHMNSWGRFLFNSRYTEREARRHGVEPADADVLSPGIEDRFLDQAPQQPWGWRMGYVGRVDPNKGVETPVAALAELPEAHLTIVGDGHPGYIDELAATARRLGGDDRITFSPGVASDSLPAVYAEADVIVFPVRWSEPWGLVPLEAMGIGRPVVATARGGPEEFLRHEENALVIPADDAAALAAAVRRLADEPELRSRLIDGGRKTAMRHRAIDFEQRMVAELERAADVSRRD